MVEKLASSEIAQSRERNMQAVEQSEKMWEKHFSKAAPELSKKGMFCYGYESGFAAAERDTRERCAQIAKDIAKEVGGNFADTHRLNVGLNKFIKELERIRGKE